MLQTVIHQFEASIHESIVSQCVGRSHRTLILLNFSNEFLCD